MRSSSRSLGQPPKHRSATSQCRQTLGRLSSLYSPNLRINAVFIFYPIPDKSRIQAYELRHQVLHDGHRFHRIKVVAGLDEPVHRRRHVVIVVLADGGDHDLVVGSGLGVLAGGEEFLVEFLAVAEAGEFDLHVGAAGEADHALREVHDLDRFAHVEDIDLAALAHAAGFQHQLASLGDGHEVADDFRVGDGDGAAGGNLLAEERNHGTVGAQHVTEAGGDELRRGGTVLLDLAGQGLDIDLADTLGAAHDVGGVHGLVGGDHHESAHLVFHGEVREDLRAQDVVLDGLGHVVFHHGHMLVGGRMEHVFGLVFGEDGLHPGLVGDVGNQRRSFDLLPLILEFQADIVQRGLGLVDQDHLVGVEHRHLPHDLAADGAGRTRDEHALPFQMGSNLLHVDLDGIPAQQVLDLDLLDGLPEHLQSSPEMISGAVNICTPVERSLSAKAFTSTSRNLTGETMMPLIPFSCNTSGSLSSLAYTFIPIVVLSHIAGSSEMNPHRWKRSKPLVRMDLAMLMPPAWVP